MTIQHRLSTAAPSSSSPISVSSAGVVSGDRLFLHLRLTDDIAPTSVPSGFTLVPGAEVLTAGGIRVYTKVATGSEPATYDFSFASGTGRSALTAIYSDVPLEIQIDDVSANSDTGTVATWDEVTALVNDSFLLAFYSGSASQNPSADTGMTKRYDLAGSNPIFMMTQGGVAAGATGVRNITVTSANHRLVMIVVSETPLDIPETPTGFDATGATTSSINLTWTDASDNETSFVIERSPDGSTDWEEVLFPVADAQSATDTGLDIDTTYYYRIAAVGDDGVSDWSDVVSATTLSVGSHASFGYHIYFDVPTVVFKARVNLPSATYPLLTLPFDGVTVGAFGDIIPDMTLLLGSTDGADDLGRVRVHNVATSTEIPVGRISRGTEDGSLSPVDNCYITVLDDYRVWSKIPRMIIDPETDDDITTYKDANIPVLSYNDQIPPLANAGPFFADYISDDEGVITVTFPMNGVDISTVIAAGATITEYQWDIVDGTLVSGSLTDPTITATFPAGRRWVGLTVMDSNGKVQTSRTFVLAVDPNADVTYQDWSNVSFGLTKQGQTLDIALNSNLARGTYLDGCLTLVWKDAPASPGDRNHMKFCGWQQSEDWSVGSGQRGFSRNTKVHCVDVGGRLSVLPGFPQALERSEEVAWEYMPDLTMNRALNYLGAWHTTAWSVADIILPLDADYPTLRLDTGASNIFDQLASTAKKMAPSHILTCTPHGQLVFMQDWMEVEVGSRPTASHIFLEDDMREVSVQYNRQPQAHSLHVGALKTSTSWMMLGGEKTIPLLFSIAPGDAFSQGTNEVVQSQGLCQSQDILNTVTGLRYARINARYEPFKVSLASLFDFWELAPSYMRRVQLNLGEEYTAQRGLDFTSAYGMLQDMTIRLNNSKRGYSHNVTLSWEKEVSGFPGITHIPEDVGESEYNPPPPVPTEPPPMGGGTGTGKMAGIGIDGYRYRTFDFNETSPTWERHDLGLSDAYSWIVDPFSPGYISGTGAINGWVARDNGIYRVEDLYGSTTATLIHTFPVATDSGSFHWRTISASFGAFFGSGFNPWLLCVSYYGDTSGHEGTWATRSTDGGVTWEDEVQISQHYSSATPTRFNPIGLWLSPRTPGKAYTVAYLEDSITTSGFVTTDWGATWTETETFDPGVGLAGTIHVPWQGNETEQVIYYGYQTSLITTDEELMPTWGVWDAEAEDWNLIGPLTTFTLQANVSVGFGDGTLAEDLHALCAPPPNTKRVTFAVAYNMSVDINGGSVGTTAEYDVNKHASTEYENTSGSLLEVEAQSTPGEYSFSGITASDVVFSGVGDWPGTDNVEILTLAPTAVPAGLTFQASASAGPALSGRDATVNVSLEIVILEIELQDGTIYVPSTGNREFRLRRSSSGIITDISPILSDVSFGPNRGPFGVRAHDSNNQHVLAAVMGNSVSTDPADDTHALFVSINGGDSWDEVIAPMADTEAPTDRPALEAAWSGDDEETLFIWGPPGYFGYSDDLGATIQDKSGNLDALGLTGFIGIAGAKA